MASNKTIPTSEKVKDFIASVPNKRKQQDSETLIQLMKSITGEEPVMWGPSIIGFGTYHYKYESGREGDLFSTGFSPRKTALTLYIMAGFKKYDALMSKLGKYKIGKSCLYIKTLDDIDMEVLRQLVTESVAYITTKYQ